MASRLNFGCGRDIRDGWTNFDVIPANGVVTPNEAGGEWTLPFRRSSFDMAVANHSLCAIKHNEVDWWLSELHRVLVPDGVLRILVPDIARAFRAYEEGDRLWFPTLGTETVDEAFTAYLTWWSENRSVFTVPSLLGRLSRAGFRACSTEVGRSLCPNPTILALDSRPNESIVVEGVKRA